MSTSIIKRENVKLIPSPPRIRIQGNIGDPVQLFEQVVIGSGRRPASVFSIVINDEVTDITSERVAFEAYGQIRSILERVRR
jgi:hypothetical protein